MLSMNRTRRGWVCITSDTVRVPSPKKRTPFINDTVGHAGGREDDVLARCKVPGLVDALEVGDAHGAATRLMLRRVHDEAGKDLAAEAADRRGRQHALGCAAGTHHRVDPAADHGGCDAGRQVAVADQPDAGTSGANLLDQSGVPGRSRTMITRS